VGAGLPAKAADQSPHIQQATPTMHTTIIITFGLILLALMLFIGEKIGFSRQTLTYSFIVLWLALTMINGAIGVVTAGQSVTTEMMVGSIVFGVPVAALVLFMVLTAQT